MSGSATGQPRANRGMHALYLMGALVALSVVFTGFAKTYFLKGAFGTPSLTPLVQLHGFVMTTWFLLFFVQAWLVASHRVALHRKLGMFGGFWAIVLVVVGVTTAITAAGLGHSPGPPPLQFLVVPLGDMLVFSVLVSLGLAFRSNRETHRRLMLLTALGILTAAIARIPLDFIHKGGIPVYFGITDLILITAVLIDTIKFRRLHPAFLWGTLFIIASQPLRLMLSGTGIWMRFAHWAVG